MKGEDYDQQIVIYSGKPSVALEFAKTLGIKGNKRDGYIESSDAIVTWCIGHLDHELS